jgi:hypothetical protein
MTSASTLRLWCDDCDRDPLTVATSEEPTAAEKATLRELLVAMARRLGWRVAGRRHQCPACREAKPGACPRCHAEPTLDCAFARCKEPVTGPPTVQALQPVEPAA